MVSELVVPQLDVQFASGLIDLICIGQKSFTHVLCTPLIKMHAECARHACSAFCIEHHTFVCLQQENCAVRHAAWQAQPSAVPTALLQCCTWVLTQA